MGGPRWLRRQRYLPCQRALAAAERAGPVHHWCWRGRAPPEVASFGRPFGKWLESHVTIACQRMKLILIQAQAGAHAQSGARRPGRKPARLAGPARRLLGAQEQRVSNVCDRNYLSSGPTGRAFSHFIFYCLPPIGRRRRARTPPRATNCLLGAPPEELRHSRLRPSESGRTGCQLAGGARGRARVGRRQLAGAAGRRARFPIFPLNLSASCAPARPDGRPACQVAT